MIRALQIHNWKILWSLAKNKMMQRCSHFFLSSALLLQSPGWTAAKHSFIREPRAIMKIRAQRQSGIHRREKNGTRERRYNRPALSQPSCGANKFWSWMFATPLADNKTPLEPLGGESIPTPLCSCWHSTTVRCKNGNRQRPEWIWHVGKTVCKHSEFASKWKKCHKESDIIEVEKYSLQASSQVPIFFRTGFFLYYLNYKNTNNIFSHIFKQ